MLGCLVECGDQVTAKVAYHGRRRFHLQFGGVQEHPAAGDDHLGVDGHRAGKRAGIQIGAQFEGVVAGEDMAGEAPRSRRIMGSGLLMGAGHPTHGTGPAISGI